MEEFDLLGDSKYRSYMTQVDRALNNDNDDNDVNDVNDNDPGGQSSQGVRVHLGVG